MRGIALVSGGIDSPVALYLMLNRGWDIVAIHMDNQPFTDEQTVKKYVDIVDTLRKKTGKNFDAYIVPHGRNQGEIAKNCTRRYQCVLCRRTMFRIASEFAGKYEAKFIITGESLGQVASQTLENIFAEHSAARVHVLRPLIGMDKLEIERIAKLCGTFSISTRPGMCCTIVPEKPATCASVEQIQIEEKKIDFDEMVRVSVCSAEKI